MTISVTNIKLFLLAFGPYSGIDDTYPLAQICFEMTNQTCFFQGHVCFVCVGVWQSVQWSDRICASRALRDILVCILVV